MTSQRANGAGFFLVLPIVVGFAWGLVIGTALIGALIGLGVGLLLALAVWLLDRARRLR